MAEESPLRNFATFKTNEGPEITGYSTILCMTDCHRPDYTGFVVADFSTGFPTQRIVYDFDTQNRTDGYHIAKDQTEVLSPDQGLAQLTRSVEVVSKRLGSHQPTTFADRLLLEYLTQLQSLEEKLKQGKKDEFHDLLDNLGKGSSKSFIGYESVESSRDNYGWNSAPLKPEDRDLTGLNVIGIEDGITPEVAALLYDTYGSRDLTFWPVSKTIFLPDTLDIGFSKR